MEDVAKLTGLSRTTVDRVLNNRAGVKDATRRKVAEALRELDYAQSALARISDAPVDRVEVLLSQGENPFFQELHAGMEAARKPFVQAGYDIRIRGFDPYRPDHMIETLNSVDPKVTTLVTVGMDTPDVRDAMRAHKDRGLRVISLITDVPGSGRDAFVGQDSFRAGRTAARLMSGLVPQGKGDIAVLLGHLQFRHLLDRNAGFQQVIGLDRPDLTCHMPRPVNNDPESLHETLSDLQASCPDLKGIYLVGALRPALLKALYDFPNVVTIAHELSEDSRAALEDNRLAAVVAYDLLDLGHKTIATALDPNSGDAFCTIQVYLKDNLP